MRSYENAYESQLRIMKQHCRITERLPVIVEWYELVSKGDQAIPVCHRTTLTEFRGLRSSLRESGTKALPHHG